MTLNIPRGFVKRNERVGKFERSRSTDWFCVYSIVKYFTIMFDSHVYQDVWKFMAFYENSSPGSVVDHWPESRMPTILNVWKSRLAANQGGNLARLCS